MGDRGGSSPFIRTKGYRQAVRHKTLTLARGSSNLPTPAKDLTKCGEIFLFYSMLHGFDIVCVGAFTFSHILKLPILLV